MGGIIPLRRAALSRYDGRLRQESAKPFRKAQSGNPAGKRRGTRHRSTLAFEKLMQEDSDAVVLAVIAAAKDGDMAAARIILDRITPVRKGRPVYLTLPAAKSAGGVADAVTMLIASMAAGVITPDEAATIGGVLELRRKAIETGEFESRLAKLETKSGDQK
jgi:hypothetical protein